eukprot:14040411-Alexandrium_andersonii.AAC.1
MKRFRPPKSLAGPSGPPEQVHVRSAALAGMLGLVCLAAGRSPPPSPPLASGDPPAPSPASAPEVHLDGPGDGCAHPLWVVLGPSREPATLVTALDALVGVQVAGAHFACEEPLDVWGVCHELGALAKELATW